MTEQKPELEWVSYPLPEPTNERRVVALVDGDIVTLHAGQSNIGFAWGCDNGHAYKRDDVSWWSWWPA